MFTPRNNSALCRFTKGTSSRMEGRVPPRESGKRVTSAESDRIYSLHKAQNCKNTYIDHTPFKCNLKSSLFSIASSDTIVMESHGGGGGGSYRHIRLQTNETFRLRTNLGFRLTERCPRPGIRIHLATITVYL